MNVIVDDYVLDLQDRFTDTFDESPIYKNILKSFAQTLNEQQADLIWLSQNLLNVDVAEKWQLDLIGSLVGQERILVDFNLEERFGFEGSYKSGTFGTLADPTVGALWNSLSYTDLTAAIKLSDALYKRVIKARIITNNSTCTRDDILQVFNLLTGNENTVLTVAKNGVLQVKYTEDVGLATYFLDRIDRGDNIFPIPFGVRIETVL